MKRRQALAAIPALLAAPLTVWAQAGRAPVRIGWLLVSSQAAGAEWIAAFRAGLADFGLKEGRDLVIEERWANGRVERLPGLAARRRGARGLHPA